MGKLENYAMSNALVSVIMPIHNSQEYLNMAIDSILLQTHDNFELLVVDCKSSDHSSTIVSRYSDKRIRYMPGKNSNLQDGLRLGLSKAKGKYITFLAQADISTKDRLQELSSHLDLHQETDAVASNYRIINEDTNTTNPTDKGSFQQNYFNHISNHPSIPWGVMLRPELFKTPDALLKFQSHWWQDNTLRLAINPRPLYLARVEKPFQQTTKQSTKKEVAPSVEYIKWLQLCGAYPNPKKINDLMLPPLNTAEIKQLIDLSNKTWLEADLLLSQKLFLEQFLHRLNLDWSTASLEDSPAPLISVVMSVYNGGVHLKSAIKSILDQTYQNFEFIIINDGSTDTSQRTIESFGDSRIRLVNQTNKGLVQSLNRGIALARGPFIARMDADDVSTLERLETQLSAMLGDPGLGVVGCYWRYLDNKNSDSTITLVMPNRDIDLKRGMYAENPFAHGSTLIRKAAIDQAGGYRQDYGPTEDFDLWRRIADNWRFYSVPNVLYLYRISFEGISQNNSEVQAGFSKKIISEQFHKPLVAKSYSSIVLDAQIYKNSDSSFSNEIYNKYILQQYAIILGLFGMGALRQGVINSIALVRLSPRHSKLVLRSLIGGVLRRFGVMSKRT
jgi:glycosyltransferase involved in cell wall biosynthesis